MVDATRNTPPGSATRLERELWFWRRLALAVLAVAVLVGIGGGGWRRPLGAQTDSGLDTQRQVILKFGSYYVNANLITHVRLGNPAEGSKTLVYFAGDSRVALELSPEHGQLMQPWLDGHSFDLSVPPEDDPLPKLDGVQ